MCLAIPGRIRRIVGEGDVGRSAEVDYGFTVRSALLLYTPEATVGDYVIVQAGFAIRILPEAEAREALEYLREADRPAADAALSPAPVLPRGAPG